VLVNTVNAILVGHLGATALAAVGLSGTITATASIFFSAVSTGSTALIAQAVGAKKARRAAPTPGAEDPDLSVRVLEQSVLMALIVGLAGMLVLLPFARQSLVLMGAEPATADMGAPYLFLQALSLPFMSLLMVGNAALRGAGDTRTPMLIMTGMNVANLVLSLLLIQGPGPLPALGVTGAGIAAALARLGAGCSVIAVLRRGRQGLVLERTVSRPDTAVLRSLLEIGLPAGGESILMRVAFLAYTRAISSLGTVAYATYVVAQRVEMFGIMPAFGFAIAATTLAGQCLGAGDPARARRSVYRSAETAFAFAMVLSIVTFLFPRALLGLFTTDPEVIAAGVWPLRWVAVAEPIMSTAFCFSGGLRGMGDTRSVMWITGVGAWGVRLPWTILCITLLGLGLPGVQAAMGLDWTVRLMFFVYRFRKAERRTRAVAAAKIT
jgi:putative MATE family efflux protein